jgi:hypothetical protein
MWRLSVPDKDGRNIYMLNRDLEQKWNDMYARDIGITVPLD